MKVGIKKYICHCCNDLHNNKNEALFCCDMLSYWVCKKCGKKYKEKTEVKKCCKY